MTQGGPFLVATPRSHHAGTAPGTSPPATPQTPPQLAYHNNDIQNTKLRVNPLRALSSHRHGPAPHRSVRPVVAARHPVSDDCVCADPRDLVNQSERLFA